MMTETEQRDRVEMRFSAQQRKKRQAINNGRCNYCCNCGEAIKARTNTILLLICKECELETMMTGR